MPETANPSPLDVLNRAKDFDARVSISLQEIKRRLKDNLPGVIDAANTRYGYTTKDNQIRKPKFYAGAPSNDADDSLNGVLISASRTADSQAPRKIQSVYEVAIYSIDQRIDTEEQYWRAWDRTGLITATMGWFLTTCADANGRDCWSLLVPSASGWMPEAWEEYGGMLINYTMVIDPSKNTWDAPV